MECQLDTAAARNVISQLDYIKLGRPVMTPSGVTLLTYDGSKMKSIGRVHLKFEELSHSLSFEAIDTKMRLYPLLGIKACLELGAIKLSKTVNTVQNSVKKEKQWILDNYCFGIYR